MRVSESLQTINSEFVKFAPRDGAANLVVFLGSRGAKRFEYERYFKDAGFHQLHIREKAGARWYLDGVPGIADDLNGMAEAIDRIASICKVRDLTVLGSSMGGYAALAIGGLLRAKRVVAFSPQVKLHKGWSFSPEDVSKSTRIDVRRIVQAASMTEFKVICSTEVMDVYHASLLTGLPNVETSMLVSLHNIVTTTTRMGGATKLLNDALSGSIPTETDLNLLTPHGALEEFNDAYFNKRYAAAISAMTSIKAVTNDWPEAHLMEGHCHYSMWDYEKAISSYLIAAPRIFRLNPAHHVQLIVSYAKVGETKKSVRAFANYLDLVDEMEYDRTPYLGRLRAFSVAAKTEELTGLIDRVVNHFESGAKFPA